ncbi:MAG TPA: alcohol dehydrogenase, partial [Marinobacter sp.]|nr:alcohol dehydrogenase [Marinobacter sp.]
MDRQAKAVVCREWGKPVQVEQITVDGPKRGEITIKVAACGVCHSDLSATTGKIQYPPPLVLGHEAAGVVVEVGEGVEGFSEGDHVVSSFISMCGKCRQCVRGHPVLCESARKAMFTLPDGTVRTRDSQGEPLNVFGACGVMAEYATLHVDNCVKVAEDVPLQNAALVGCAVMTGVGAVFNTAGLEPGSRAAVFGIGGVGLNAVQGCATAGAEMIVAVDNNPKKLAMAREFGATHT